MVIYVLDDESRWVRFLESNFTTTSIIGQADLIITSPLYAKQCNNSFVVATGQPTTREAIDMYRLGALDYFAKDFRPEVVWEKLNGILV